VLDGPTGGIMAIMNKEITYNENILQKDLRDLNKLGPLPNPQWIYDPNDDIHGKKFDPAIIDYIDKLKRADKPVPKSHFEGAIIRVVWNGYLVTFRDSPREYVFPDFESLCKGLKEKLLLPGEQEEFIQKL